MPADLDEAVRVVEQRQEMLAALQARVRELEAEGMTFRAFSAENRARCEAPNGFNQPLHSWPASEWILAVVGEVGEAANIAKKLNRARDGIRGNDMSVPELRAALIDELADAYIYLDLTFQRLGVRIEDAVRSKFDRTSAKIGYARQAGEVTDGP